MRFLILFSLLFIGLGHSVIAQHARAHKFTTPLAGKVVLSQVDDKYNVNVSGVEMPEPDAVTGQEELKEIKKLVRAQYPYKVSMVGKKTSSTVQTPVLGTNFVADSFSGIPPDNCSSVNRNNKAVNVMNSNIVVHDATTGAYLQRKSLQAFSAAVGLNNTIRFTGNYKYDPKVVYDPGADRFITIILNGTNGNNWVVLGFSQTNDPTGAWNFYKLYGNFSNDTTWFDYPALSVTKNELFFTGNKLKYNTSWQLGFQQTLIYQVRKQDGYNGDTSLNYQIWDSIMYNNQPLRCLYPLNPGDSQLGPDQYFLSNRNFAVNSDSVFIVRVPDTIGSVDSVLTVTAVKATSGSYGAPPDARQTDTSLSLATNDARVLGGFIEGNEIQFVNTSVNPANGNAAVFHGVISNFRTAPSFTGSIFSIDTLDMGYPNISYSGNFSGSNQSIISFNYSGPHTFPGFGAVLCDAGNFSDMLIIHKGDTTIYQLSGKEQRWGDYSGNTPDWTSLGAVWAEGIFGHKGRQYGNYMARIVSPYQLAIPQVSAPADEQAKAYPNPAWQFVNFQFTVGSEQVFSFMIYDMQGRVVDKLTDQYCNEGKNVIQFNIAPLVTGTYFLKAIGMKGEDISISRFEKK